MASTTKTCPSGYTKSGDTCYMRTNTISSTKGSCPDGYTKDGDTCYIKKAVTTSTSKSCPSGYTKDGDTCYIKKDLTKSTKTYCPDGYADNGTRCYKRSNPRIVTTDTTYSCKSGYTKSGIGAATVCYKIVKSDDTYYCEDANATLKDKKCYVTVPSKFIGYTCPAGYITNGSLCTRTTTDTTSPIWHDAEYIYSKDSYVPGYQKTGNARFVTKCTKIAEPEEIHYK